MSKEATSSPADPASGPGQKFHLKYETMTAVFADHVVLNGTNGAIILDFASSVVGDPQSGESTIPVHTRIAMTHHGAAQLFRMLSGIFTQNPPPADAGGEK